MGFYENLVIGFHTNKEQEVFAVIPFSLLSIESKNIAVSCALETMCMKSINTVSISFKDYFIPTEKIIVVWPKQYFFNQYEKFPPFAFTIGIAMAALGLITNIINSKRNVLLTKRYHLLKSMLANIRQEIRCQPQKISTEHLFAKIMNITWRCIEFAMLTSGGSGLMNDHSLQRLYREIILWFIPRAYPTVIDYWMDEFLLPLEENNAKLEKCPSNRQK